MLTSVNANLATTSRIRVVPLLAFAAAIGAIPLLRGSTSSAEIEAEARKVGMQTLRYDGIRQALKGTTTLEEIITVTQEQTLE